MSESPNADPEEWELCHDVDHMNDIMPDGLVRNEGQESERNDCHASTNYHDQRPDGRGCVSAPTGSIY